VEIEFVLTCCRFKMEGHLSVMRIASMVQQLSLITSVYQEHLSNPG
jgi:hypothetical protein